MFSYLGLTSNEDYMAFAEMCADAHEPSGLASGIAGANHMGPPAVVQFEVSTAGIDVPQGAVVQACGSWNSWCTPNPGERPVVSGALSRDAEPLTLNSDAGFVTHVDTHMGQLTLPPGTYAYKYRIVPDPAHPEDHTWEDVPEACGVAWDHGFDRVLTVVSSPNSQFGAGAGVTLNDVFSECGSQNACTIEPVLDASFLGEANERTGDHELTLAGDAHVEADGVHCKSETLSGVSALRR